MLATLNSMYQMRLNKVNRFRAKIHIEKRIGNFVYKTVSSLQELKPALELRYQVFHRELIGKENPRGLDIDSFDSQCDHLVIIDTRKNLVVGTYRLNCSLFNDRFYSSQEFNLSRILNSPGIKLELGRACIHQEYRRGFVISMLWRGVIEYMIACGADWMFGCATIKTANPREAALLYQFFMDEKRVRSDYFAPPTLAYTMPNLNFWIPRFSAPLSAADKVEAETLLPGLCRSYLNMGAFIGGEPAFDPEFNCIDFLTILKKEELRGQVLRRLTSDQSHLR